VANSLLGLVAIVGPLFGLLGGAAAYLITYEEYSHHLLGRRRTMLLSLRAATVTFAVFVLLSFIAGRLLSPR
jgi:hypothetical protein